MGALLRTRSLRFWLAVSIALAVAPLALAAVGGFFLLNHGVIHAFRDVVQRQGAEVVAVQQVRLLMLEAETPVDEYVDGDVTRNQSYRALRQQVESGFAGLTEALQSEPEAASLVARARAAWTEADRLAAGLISVQPAAMDKAELKALESFHGQIAAATDDLSAAFKRLAADINGDQLAAERFYERALWIAGIAGGLSLLTALAGVFLIGRIISASVDRLVDGTARFAEGDREHRIDVQVPPELHRVADEFNRMAGRIRDSEHMLAELAHRDGLTGLLNRRAFDEALPEMLGRAERLGETISLLAFDIDHFKRVNDTYGHAAGDDVLKALAQIVRDQLRPIDRVFRTGGEEFAALLAGTDAGGAVEAAERLRQAIKARTVRIAGAEIGVTVSVGVAAITGTSSPDVLTGAADAALYRAKRSGRDRVVVADEAEERLQVA